MKKLLMMLVCATLLFVMTGCTEESIGVTDLEGNEKTSFNINETAVFEDVHYTVTNVEYLTEKEYETAAEGKNYVVVSLKIENKSDSKVSYDSYSWNMLNSEGQEDGEAFVIFDSNTSLDSGDLAAGGTKTGTLVFEEPINDPSLKLLYYSNIFDEESTFEIIVK